MQRLVMPPYAGSNPVSHLEIRDQEYKSLSSPIPNPGVTAFNGASSNGRAAVLYTVDVGSIPAAPIMLLWRNGSASDL